MRGSPTPPRSGDSFVDARAVLTSREYKAKMATTETRGGARIALDDDCREERCEAEAAGGIICKSTFFLLSVCTLEVVVLSSFLLFRNALFA